MAKSTMTWVEMEPGVWRSTNGLYAIVRQVLPERPPRTVWQARKIDQLMARAHPDCGDLGCLLKESPWGWCYQNDVGSAEAAIEYDAFASAHDTSVPGDHPAIAMSRFWWPVSNGLSRGALVVTRNGDDLVAQVVGMSCHDDTGFVPDAYTEISLTGLGLVSRPGATGTVTTDHGPAPCHMCSAKIGQPHGPMCSLALCLVTGRQRLLCIYFGGSPVAGMEAVATGREAEFNEFFKTRAGHDCGQDPWPGEHGE
jgi:hypothetical protein